MTFADLNAGDMVFVDANIFTYHFQPHPKWGPPCSQLLQRVENQNLHGFTSTHVLGEVAHRLMTLQASVLFNWQFAGIGNRLRTHPAEVQRLTAFRVGVERLLQSRLHVLPVAPDVLSAALAICQQVGLLTNDGLIVALMQANGLTRLVSSDTDFDRVPGITRYEPA